MASSFDAFRPPSTTAASNGGVGREMPPLPPGWTFESVLQQADSIGISVEEQCHRLWQAHTSMTRTHSGGGMEAQSHQGPMSSTHPHQPAGMGYAGRGGGPSVPIVQQQAPQQQQQRQLWSPVGVDQGQQQQQQQQPHHATGASPPSPMGGHVMDGLYNASSSPSRKHSDSGYVTLEKAFERVHLASGKMMPASPHSTSSTPTPSISPAQAALQGLVTKRVEVPKQIVGLIVGQQHCNIRPIEEETGTQIDCPRRDQEPTFIVTGKPMDVEVAVEKIQELVAANHTDKVSVPVKLVGLVVGPGGSTVLSIAERTNTQIRSPHVGREPVFIVRGAPANVKEAIDVIKEMVACSLASDRRVLGDGPTSPYSSSPSSYPGLHGSLAGGVPPYMLDHYGRQPSHSRSPPSPHAHAQHAAMGALPHNGGVVGVGPAYPMSQPLQRTSSASLTSMHVAPGGGYGNPASPHGGYGSASAVGGVGSLNVDGRSPPPQSFEMFSHSPFSPISSPQSPFPPVGGHMSPFSPGGSNNGASVNPPSNLPPRQPLSPLVDSSGMPSSPFTSHLEHPLSPTSPPPKSPLLAMSSSGAWGAPTPTDGEQLEQQQSVFLPAQQSHRQQQQQQQHQEGSGTSAASSTALAGKPASGGGNDVLSSSDPTHSPDRDLVFDPSTRAGNDDAQSPGPLAPIARPSSASPKSSPHGSPNLTSSAIGNLSSQGDGQSSLFSFPVAETNMSNSPASGVEVTLDGKADSEQDTTQLPPLDIGPDRNSCRLCMDAEIDSVLCDCGHQAYCHSCAAGLKMCPICLAPVKSCIKIHRA